MKLYRVRRDTNVEARSREQAMNIHMENNSSCCRVKYFMDEPSAVAYYKEQSGWLDDPMYIGHNVYVHDCVSIEWADVDGTGDEASFDELFAEGDYIVGECECGDFVRYEDYA